MIFTVFIRNLICLNGLHDNSNSDNWLIYLVIGLKKKRVKVYNLSSDSNVGPATFVLLDNLLFLHSSGCGFSGCIRLLLCLGCLDSLIFSDFSFLVPLSQKFSPWSRVVTHSGKLREFLNYRKSQGDSGNFDFF